MGKLKLPKEPKKLLYNAITSNDFKILPIQVEHTLHIIGLPNYHSDPFDRLLISQAQIEGLHIITGDTKIMRYDVAIFDARK